MFISELSGGHTIDEELGHDRLDVIVNLAFVQRLERNAEHLKARRRDIGDLTFSVEQHVGSCLVDTCLLHLESGHKLPALEQRRNVFDL